jgi:hypothetical protein
VGRLDGVILILDDEGGLDEGGLDGGMLDDGVLDRRVDVGRLDGVILIFDKDFEGDVRGLREDEAVVFRKLLVWEDELVQVLVAEARVSVARMLLRLIS